MSLANVLGGWRPGIPLGRTFTPVYCNEETILIRGKSDVLRSPCKGLSRKGQQNCYLPRRIFFYMVTGYGVLSEKPLETSVPRESSPDILYMLNFFGQKSRTCGGRPFIVECPQLPMSFTFTVVYYLSLFWSSLHSSSEFWNLGLVFLNIAVIWSPMISSRIKWEQLIGHGIGAGTGPTHPSSQGTYHVHAWWELLRCTTVWSLSLPCTELVPRASNNNSSRWFHINEISADVKRNSLAALVD